MPITQIGRQIQSVSISTTYSLTDPNIEQVVANTTSAGFTLTIYNDTQSGTYHRLVVKIADTDVSGNTLTIVDAMGVLSTTVVGTSASVELETTPTGAWTVVAAFPVTSAATAISAADSAGTRASAASSAAASATINASNATSAATSNSLIISQASSTATSQNGSQSLNISTTGSTATSQNGSQSLNVSTAQSTAAS